MGLELITLAKPCRWCGWDGPVHAKGYGRSSGGGKSKCPVCKINRWLQYKHLAIVHPVEDNGQMEDSA